MTKEGFFCGMIVDRDFDFVLVADDIAIAALVPYHLVQTRTLLTTKPHDPKPGQ